MAHHRSPQLEIGQRIASAREWGGLGVRELARLAGLSPSTVSRIERGIGSCLIQHAVPLADALGVSLDFLLRGVDSGGQVARARRAAATRLRKRADEIESGR